MRCESNEDCFRNLMRGHISNFLNRNKADEQPKKAPKLTTADSSYDFKDEIRCIMHTCGDVEAPLWKSVKEIQNILRFQMNILLLKATRVARSKKAKSISHQHILFIMRMNKVKLRRMLMYLNVKDAKDAYHQNSQQNSTSISEVSMYPERGRRVASCLNYLSKLDSENFKNLLTDKLDDSIVTRRRIRKDLMTRHMSAEDYNIFNQQLQVSFYPKYDKDRFKNWLLMDRITDLVPNSLALEVFSYLVRETIAEIIDLCLIVKNIEQPVAIYHFTENESFNNVDTISNVPRKHTCSEVKEKLEGCKPFKKIKLTEEISSNVDKSCLKSNDNNKENSSMSVQQSTRRNSKPCNKFSNTFSTSRKCDRLIGKSDKTSLGYVGKQISNFGKLTEPTNSTAPSGLEDNDYDTFPEVSEETMLVDLANFKDSQIDSKGSSVNIIKKTNVCDDVLQNSHQPENKNGQPNTLALRGVTETISTAESNVAECRSLNPQLICKYNSSDMEKAIGSACKNGPDQYSEIINLLKDMVNSEFIIANEENKEEFNHLLTKNWNRLNHISKGKESSFHSTMACDVNPDSKHKKSGNSLDKACSKPTCLDNIDNLSPNTETINKEIIDADSDIIFKEDKDFDLRIDSETISSVVSSNEDSESGIDKNAVKNDEKCTLKLGSVSYVLKNDQRQLEKNPESVENKHFLQNVIGIFSKKQQKTVKQSLVPAKNLSLVGNRKKCKIRSTINHKANSFVETLSQNELKGRNEKSNVFYDIFNSKNISQPNGDPVSQNCDMKHVQEAKTANDPSELYIEQWKQVFLHSSGKNIDFSKSKICKKVLHKESTEHVDSISMLNTNLKHENELDMCKSKVSYKSSNSLLTDDTEMPQQLYEATLIQSDTSSANSTHSCSIDKTPHQSSACDVAQKDENFVQFSSEKNHDLISSVDNQNCSSDVKNLNSSTVYSCEESTRDPFVQSNKLNCLFQSHSSLTPKQSLNSSDELSKIVQSLKLTSEASQTDKQLEDVLSDIQSPCMIESGSIQHGDLDIEQSNCKDFLQSTSSSASPQTLTEFIPGSPVSHQSLNTNFQAKPRLPFQSNDHHMYPGEDFAAMEGRSTASQCSETHHKYEQNDTNSAITSLCNERMNTQFISKESESMEYPNEKLFLEREPITPLDIQQAMCIFYLERITVKSPNFKKEDCDIEEFNFILTC